MEIIKESSKTQKALVKAKDAYYIVEYSHESGQVRTRRASDRRANSHPGFSGTMIAPASDDGVHYVAYPIYSLEKAMNAYKAA